MDWHMMARGGWSARVLVVGAFGLSASVGCSVYDASLIADAEEGCPGARPPARVNGVGLEPGPDEPVYTVILRDIQANQAGDPTTPLLAPWRSIGFNLDNLCLESPVQECDTVGRTVPADGNDGIDNTFGSTLFELLELAFAIYQDNQGLEQPRSIQTDLTMSQAEGAGAVLLLIEGWNGQRDDARVTVTVAGTVAGTSQDAIDGLTVENFQVMNGATRAPLPAWDGEDYFWVREDDFNETADFPRNRVQDAYVVDGVLVAELPDRTPIRLTGERVAVTVQLSGLVATGNIYDFFVARTGMPPIVTVAGRWGRNDLLTEGEHLGLCLGDNDFLLRALDSNLDLLGESPDVPDPTLPCTHMSTAVTFRAYEGRFAGLAEGRQVVDLCP